MNSIEWELTSNLQNARADIERLKIQKRGLETALDESERIINEMTGKSCETTAKLKDWKRRAVEVLREVDDCCGGVAARDLIEEASDE